MSGYTSIVDSTPMFVPGNFDGQDVRLATVGNVVPGLFASGDFAVSQRAAGANMSLDIAAGRAYVDPQDVVRQGSYLVWRGSSFNTSSDGGYTWTAADPTNPRIDLLGIEVEDTDFGGTFTGWKFRVIDGTPNAGATDESLRAYWPAIPTGFLPLAAIRVPAAATTLTTANILNLAQVGGPGVGGRYTVVDVLPTNPFDGQVVLFQTAAMATAGYMPWMLRYNAGSASSYKWEAISPPTMVASSETLVNTTSASFNAPTATDIAIPLVGEYLMQCGHTGGAGGGNAGVLSSITSYGMVTGTGPTASDSYAATQTLPTGEAATPQSVVSRPAVRTVTAIGNMRSYLRTGTGGQDTRFSNRWISAAPVRVA